MQKKIIFYKILYYLPAYFHFHFMFLINCIRFKKKFYILNYSHPNTFNELVNNLKSVDINSKAVFSDKLQLKQQLKELFEIDVNTASVLHVFSSEDELRCFDFKRYLKGQYLIKANHGSGMNRFYDNGEAPTTNDLMELSEWFKFPSHFSSRELHYSLIEKKMFVEVSLGVNLSDYKVYCYNGHCSIIQVDVNRFSNHKRAIFNENWETLNINYVYNQPEITPEEPFLLGEMLKKSNEIAINFPFVRIDWYVAENQLYLGELTFHPEGGLGPFDSKNEDKQFLEMLIRR